MDETGSVNVAARKDPLGFNFSPTSNPNPNPNPTPTPTPTPNFHQDPLGYVGPGGFIDLTNAVALTLTLVLTQALTLALALTLTNPHHASPLLQADVCIFAVAFATRAKLTVES